MKVATVLDLKGLKCPLPVLKTRKAMRDLAKGDIISMETTDPLAVIDIPAFCNEQGHNLLKVDEKEGCHEFFIEKGGIA